MLTSDNPPDSAHSSHMSQDPSRVPLSQSTCDTKAEGPGTQAPVPTRASRTSHVPTRRAMGFVPPLLLPTGVAPTEKPASTVQAAMDEAIKLRQKGLFEQALIRLKSDFLRRDNDRPIDLTCLELYAGKVEQWWGSSLLRQGLPGLADARFALAKTALKIARAHAQGIDDPYARAHMLASIVFQQAMNERARRAEIINDTVSAAFRYAVPFLVEAERLLPMGEHRTIHQLNYAFIVTEVDKKRLDPSGEAWLEVILSNQMQRRSSYAGYTACRIGMSKLERSLTQLHASSVPNSQSHVGKTHVGKQAVSPLDIAKVKIAKAGLGLLEQGIEMITSAGHPEYSDYVAMSTRARRILEGLKQRARGHNLD